MRKLFGTDGIRGIANVELTSPLAFRIGQAGATVLALREGHRPLIVIGKDTRISSDMLEAALISGICSVGADVISLGVVPTPAVAYLTREYGADAGIVISASHNPMEHNGIKFFNQNGFKLSDETEAEIEALILGEEPLPVKTGDAIGRVRPVPTAADVYVHYLRSLSSLDLAGLRVAVDCANGAASATADLLFGNLGARAALFYNQPDGVNINAGCGSTHLKNLSAIVSEGSFDLGIAFDGDADRCLLVDETGSPIDGDQILAVCAADLKARGALKNDGIVVTVLTNMGFHKHAEALGISVGTSGVGDRYVLEEMQKQGFVLGGEQSGHIIFLEHNTTGDGQLTALMFLEALKRSGKKASELASCFTPFPQTMLNVKLSSNEAKSAYQSDPELLSAIRDAEERLGKSGRVLIRPSGTEPLIRVMTEGEDASAAHETATALYELLLRKYGCQ